MSGSRHRLLLCRGASCSAQVTHTRCLTEARKLWFLVLLVACLLATCLLNEAGRESSSRQAITPARHDDETLATNHNAATEKRGCHNTGPPWRAVYADTWKNQAGTKPIRRIRRIYRRGGASQPTPTPLTCKAEADQTRAQQIKRQVRT